MKADVVKNAIPIAHILFLFFIPISILIKNINTHFVKLLKKYYYYIDNDDNYILTIPLFELYNIYSGGIVNKCRYYLYKLMFKLKYGRKERSKDID